MDLAALSRRVATSEAPEERFAHARDLWPRATLALAHGELPTSPRAVAWPRDEAEVSDCLRWASDAGVPVVPWGAGSGVCGAAAGRGDALVLDLKRMNRLVELDAARRVCRVEAGMLGQHLEDALEARGFATRHSPSSIWCSTVGGWAASRSAGQFSSRYGKFEDMVRAMRVVAPTGAFGTGEWAEGRDLGPWVMGAEGALGVITELLVDVVPVPRARWLRGYRFSDVETAWGAMRALMQADLHPFAVRLYDPVDTRVGGRLGGSGKRASSAWWSRLQAMVDATPALKDHALSLPLSLPGLVNRIAQGVSDGCLLVVGFEGEPETTEICARHGHALLCEAGEDLGAAPGEAWYTHRHDVSYKLSPIFAHGGFADTMEVCALWSRLGDLYAGVRAALGRHGLVMAHFSHVWREGCSIYFTFAGAGRLDVYDAAWRDALAAAAEAGGTVAHHHGVGQLKMHAAAREMAGVAPHYRALKAELDPDGILNPGRLFPDVEVPESPRPAHGVDAVSLVATLGAQQAAPQRDAWLADRGYALRFPTDLPLAHASSRGARPWESRTLGASYVLDGRRIVLLPVPRSAAGPDPRRALPAAAMETVTVPVVPLGERVVRVARTADDVRPSRTLADGVELRGPAADDLARLS